MRSPRRDERAPRPHPGRSALLRLLLGVFLTVSMLPGAARPAATVRAEEPVVRDHRDPSARIQLVVKRVIVHDDLDWGKGDIKISVKIRTGGERCEPYQPGECGRVVAEATFPEFSASDGESKQLDRIVPGAGDAISDPAAGPEIGLPFRTGQWYGFEIYGVENDPADDDVLGLLAADITSEQGQVRYGTRTERGLGRCVKQFGRIDFCTVGVPAAFSVEYEIRRAPLPDLRPTAFRIAVDAPGDRDDQVCFTVENRGLMDSEPFRATIEVEGAEPPSRDVGAFGLAAGQTREQCTGIRMPDSGSHQLRLSVDREDAIAEMDDTNNRYERLLVHTGTGGPGPIVTTGTTNANPGASDPSNGGTLPAGPIGTWHGPAQSEPPQVEPAQSEPPQVEPAQSEPPQGEPAQSEPAQNEPAQGEPSATSTAPAPGPAPSSTPAPTPTQSVVPSPGAGSQAAEPDLTVGAVKVNGQAPDGKDDCKDDKNAVTVAVKNGGKGNASAFTVRLLVDGDEAGEQPVSGLEAGQQREVRFGDVRLKKGKHTLAIAVDPKGAVAESDEENNERAVTATCKADD